MVTEIKSDKSEKDIYVLEILLRDDHGHPSSDYEDEDVELFSSYSKITEGQLRVEEEEINAELEGTSGEGSQGKRSRISLERFQNESSLNVLTLYLLKSTFLDWRKVCTKHSTLRRILYSLELPVFRQDF